jgi:16S rRNA processing protein RimM
MARTSGSTSSTEQDRRAPTAPRPWVALGRVAGAFGTRGGLRVRALGDAADWENVPGIALGSGEGEPDSDEYEVASVAPGRAGEVRLALVGIADRDAALALRGRWVFARPRHLPALADGEYYAYELVGCAVEELGGRRVGVVRGIWETGAADVLVVADAAGGEHLIPAAGALLLEVDVAARRIVIEALPGLVGEPAEPPEGAPRAGEVGDAD